MPKLGINIDHVATLRQARGGEDPDPVSAAVICEKAGADSIVCHLREDRRHIIDSDLPRLKRIVKTRLNLEMSINPKIVEIALKVRPDQITLVPERRQEITTEGGLDVVAHFKRIQEIVEIFQKKNITVNLFIAPNKVQIEKAKETGALMIELHTGLYSLAKSKKNLNAELSKIKTMIQFARRLGLIVNAGHGLNYTNTQAIAAISDIEELNIGHAVISRAVFVGLKNAVKEMLKIVRGYS